YLRANYGSMTVVQMAKTLNRSALSVHGALKRFGINESIKKAKRVTDEECMTVMALIGKLSKGQIAIKLGISRDRVKVIVAYHKRKYGHNQKNMDTGRNQHPPGAIPTGEHS